MEFKSIEDLESLLTLQQLKEAKKNYNKFYKKLFGKTKPIYPIVEAAYKTDDEEYLKEVNLDDFI